MLNTHLACSLKRLVDSKLTVLNGTRKGSDGLVGVALHQRIRFMTRVPGLSRNHALVLLVCVAARLQVLLGFVR